jgi:hypothetical protein
MDSTLPHLKDSQERLLDVYWTRERVVSFTPDDSSHLVNLANSYSSMVALYAETSGAHAEVKAILDATIPPPTNAKQRQQWRKASPSVNQCTRCGICPTTWLTEGARGSRAIAGVRSCDASAYLLALLTNSVFMPVSYPTCSAGLPTRISPPRFDAKSGRQEFP